MLVLFSEEDIQLGKHDHPARIFDLADTILVRKNDGQVKVVKSRTDEEALDMIAGQLDGVDYS